MVKKDNHSKLDVKSRATQAKKVFADERKQLLTSSLNIEIRKSLLKPCIPYIDVNVNSR